MQELSAVFVIVSVSKKWESELFLTICLPPLGSRGIFMETTIRPVNKWFAGVTELVISSPLIQP